MSVILLKQRIAVLQAQISSAGIPGGSVSAADARFGAGTGGDDVAKIVAAIAYASANGLTRVHLPAGEYTLDCQDTADSTTLQALISVPSNMMISGDGPWRTIINVTNATSDAGYGVNCFGVNAKSNVIFEGLHFVGENDPYAYVYNNQGSCIRVYDSENVIIRDCRFESLFGFSGHDDASERVHMLDCSFEDCANGPNMNGSHSLVSRLSMIRSEGPECSGSFCIYSEWDIEDAQGVGASLGGNQGAEQPGNIASDITIDGSTGNGLVITNGFCLSSVSNVVVRHCATAGLVVLSDGAVPCRNITFNNVTVDSNCAHPNLGVIVGVDIRKVHADDGGHAFFNCRFTDQADAGYRQIQAFSLNAPNCSVDNCIFQGHTATATNKDASFGANCTNLKLGGNNTFKNATQEFLSGCTIAASELLGIATTDRVFEFRLWNDSAGSGRRRFAIQRDGKMTWGNGLSLEDTNFYRNAADQLKTDDKFLAAAGIGVGNSASASSSVGTLVKKIEVFDASGNSLGFVPVYDAIT